MSKIMEKPFEYLKRRENGEKYEDEIVKNWYIARSFILDKLKDVAFKPDSNDHLHVVVTEDSPLMLCVVRQIALSAHYINFNEEAEDESTRNRTVITLVSKNPGIKKELEKEEYLCNLPKYCKYSEDLSKIENADSFIDVEIHVTSKISEFETTNNKLVINKESVEDFYKQQMAEGVDIFSIDTRKAVYANRIYSLGDVIDNLPAEDIHSASRYSLALNVFQYNRLKEVPKPLIEEHLWEDQNKVKEALSNIFCSDCFKSRYQSIKLCSNGDKKRERHIWEENNEALSESEHARWVVEKLIMGYSPLNVQQRFKDESLFYNTKKKALYRKILKKNDCIPAHIDLCSYRDLRRINPNDLKYDSFLMLAIPKILEKIKGDE